MVTQTERILWSRWRTARDADAFEQLVRPHLRFATDLARRRGCTAADADDIVQHVLAGLLEERSDRPAQVGFRAWIGRAVSLRSRVVRRGEARRARREQAVATRTPAPAEDRLEQQEQVERALADLPERLREAVVLRYLHDLEYGEIAHVLGATQNACRIRVHRGVDALREKLRAGPETSLALLPLLRGLPGADPLRASLAAAASTGAAAAFTGVLVMKKISIAGSVLAAASVGALLVWNGGGDAGDPELRARATAAAGASRPEPPSAAPASAETTGSAPAAVARPPAPAPAEPSLVAEILAAGGRVSFDPRDVYRGGKPRWLEAAPEEAHGPITGVSFTRGRVQDLLERLVAQGALHWAVLYGTDVDDALLELLARLPALDGLHLGRTQLTDEGLRHVGRIDSLTMLALHDTKATDAGLKHLAGLSRLEDLDLHDLHITDAGMEHVGRLTQLERLRLGGTRITDEGFRRLSGLDRLTHLDLEEAAVTGAGLRHIRQDRLVEVTCEGSRRVDDSLLEALRGASALETLNLEETSVTDAGLAHLTALVSLRKLHLGATRVTDDGLAQLAAVPGLEVLNLEDTAVSDAAVDHLARLRRLKKLFLKDTRVTADGAMRLRDALPDCEVESD